MAQCRISHVTMKNINFLPSLQGIMVLGLDFMPNWQRYPVMDALFRGFIQDNNRVTGT